MGDNLARAIKALRNERNRWVMHTNLDEGRYEAWRWRDDLSQKTEIIPLGNGPGGVEAAQRFNMIVDERCVKAVIDTVRSDANA